MKSIFIIFLPLILCKKNTTNIIVTNHPICTRIAKNIKGNIIDTAINIMLCEGIVAPQDSGIGGGFYGIINFKNKKFIINARERTPFKINYRKQINQKFCNIGIPGAIKGYKLLHDKFGKLSWKDIIKPLISICYKKLGKEPKKIAQILNLTNILPYNKALCKTLQKIQIHGPDYFYKNISKLIIKDLHPFNKYITYNDFISYKPIIQKPIITKYGNYTIYSPRYPAANYIPQTFKRLLKTKNLFYSLEKAYKKISNDRYYNYFHKIPNKIYIGNKHGTSNICVKKRLDYLCITSTINLYYGSRFYSKSSGIILNNQLDDIPVYYNKIPSRMIPPTSISTSFIIKNNKLNLALGGTGGSRIPSSIINVLYNFYILKNSLKSSVAKNRFYYGIGFEQESSYNTVTGITSSTGVFDPRRGGLTYIEKIYL